MAYYDTDEPVVRLVDTLIRKAIDTSASDIHLESTDAGLRARYRIDGLLHDQAVMPDVVMRPIISHIKVLSHIDITEKRVPQDGKFRIDHGGNSVDLRVSTFPALYGEKIVIRILDRGRTSIKLDQLGFSDAMRAQCQAIIERAHGFFLVSGPTGSGKTTTLYAALAALNDAHKNIITLEDPVEYNLNGITQGQINTDAGFTFARGMRALLRQDPDIVMVGEIRDTETARIAIEAALTGHFVLSTVHTNDAPSVIMRLMDMGIEPFLINAALTGVLAQRLARTICAHCRIEIEPTGQEKELVATWGLSLDHAYKGAGCEACNNLGYKGRTGIFELLTMDAALRALIVRHPSFDAIYQQAIASGMTRLVADGMAKVNTGVITLSELIRVAV